MRRGVAVFVNLEIWVLRRSMTLNLLARIAL
jgi:hypothetical protein